MKRQRALSRRGGTKEKDSGWLWVSPWQEGPEGAASASQKPDLVHWGHFAHTILAGCEVDVLRGHGAGHREVLEDGGEEEE